MTYKLYNGDCLEIMPTFKAGSIDAIITDLPYGTTACKWDMIIPFEPMWKEVKRVLKINGAFITTASQPFTSALIMSDPKYFKYEWIWRKRKPGNIQQAKKQPLRVTENILVFGNKINYYPIPRPLPQSSIDRRKYKIESKVKNLKHMSSGNYKFQNNMGDGFGYPFNIIEFGQDAKSIHPTQKPVALYEYLIKTYTSEGETVLDITMGSGTTIEAAERTGRNSIGIEKDVDIFNAAKNRVENYNKSNLL